jgi:glycosyltransferase involved in cell wall biosynthesis
MKINYVDPGLNELAGHHFAYAVKILEYLKTQGHDVVVYSHKNTQENVVIWLSKYFPVVKLFDAFPYPIYENQIIDYNQQVESLKNSYKLMRESDIWLFSSLFSFQFEAAQGYKIIGCVHGPDNKWNDLNLYNAKIGVTNKNLLKDFEVHSNVFLIPLLEIDNNVDKPKKELKTIGFFGCQRKNKGDYIIKQLIDKLENTYDIILHDGWNKFKINSPNVTNVGFVPNIFKEMEKCDLIIFPHNEDYQKRISGIFIHCLSLGIPCIVPNDTTLSECVVESKSGLIFNALESDEIVNLVKTIDEKYQYISSNAYNYSILYNKKNGIEKFMEKLLK